MRSSGWVFAGLTVGVAVTLLYFYEPSLQNETGYDGVEDAANEAWRWGSKTRIAGGGDSVVGRVKALRSDRGALGHAPYAQGKALDV